MVFFDCLYESVACLITLYYLLMDKAMDHHLCYICTISMEPPIYFPFLFLEHRGQSYENMITLCYLPIDKAMDHHLYDMTSSRQLCSRLIITQ